MPVDASLTPRRCALLLVAIVGVFCLIVASFLSDLRIDATQPPDLSEASASTDEGTSGRFSAERDTGPYPGYYTEHLHWFVQVCDSISLI